MNKLKKNELGLIRSRILATLFSLLLSLLIVTPLLAFPKTDGKGKKGSIYMHPLSKESHATVTLANFEEGKYTLTIESENGVDVYYDAILDSPEKFSKIFDFSRLEDGEYTLRVKSRNKTKERYFEISGGEIKVYYEEKAEPVFKPVGKKAVFVLPNAENKRYAIKVISPEGDELYATSEKKDTIRKLFDFSQVDEGNYTVLVYSGSEEFAFDFHNKNWTTEWLLT